MIGRTLSHYEILEKLGEGGMGVVYKARDTRLNRFVALKVLPPDKVADPERKRRFIHEAQAASALNHPNIVTIYDIGSEGGVDFIAMEFITGKTLDRQIPRHGMPLAEAFEIAVQMADGLAAAHRAGILHRDFKPGNVMVTDAGAVKILDFGLAKLTEIGDDDRTLDQATKTAEGTILGTVSYMSPEQAQAKKLDTRSDIFSFGAVLYEMVTGRRAFQGDSTATTLSAILRDEPPPAGQIASGVPPELERVIARCLKKDLRRRFQDMDDLKVALEELKEESASGKLSTISAPAAAAPSKSRWKFAAAAAAAGVLVVAAAIWFLLFRSEAPEPPLTVTPLTTEPGVEIEPSFSPDANQVAFAWNGPNEDNLDIYAVRASRCA